MTIDNVDVTGEREHAALLGSGLTARQIALSHIRIADSDMRTAFYNLSEGNTDETLKILDECLSEMQAARDILTGKMWSLAM